jgi:hypothetical protein
MKTTNIANIIKELRRQEFCEIDSLEKMGCDAEEIEGARGVVTVEPNYDTDGHGRAVDMVTVDGRRFAELMTRPRLPRCDGPNASKMSKSGRWAASIGGTVVKG